MTEATIVWRIKPNGVKFQQHVITWSSTFSSFKVKDGELSTRSGREEAARKLIAGWKNSQHFPANTVWGFDHVKNYRPNVKPEWTVEDDGRIVVNRSAA